MSTGDYPEGSPDPAESPQGIHIRTILIVGLVLVAAGAFIVAHALSAKPQLPSAAAQDIPASVSTKVPFSPNPASVAAPLAVSTPLTIVIPAIKVEAPVMNLGLNPDGTVQVPPLGDHDLAGWYDGSVPAGATGTSVILGHVDNSAGPSVFFNIKNLRQGDAIDVVRSDGVTAVFAVDGVQKAAKAHFPTIDVFGNVPYPALRLVTCGGPFDPETGEYLDSIIVYAHLASTVAK